MRATRKLVQMRVSPETHLPHNRSPIPWRCFRGVITAENAQNLSQQNLNWNTPETSVRCSMIPNMPKSTSVQLHFRNVFSNLIKPLRLLRSWVPLNLISIVTLSDKIKWSVCKLWEEPSTTKSFTLLCNDCWSRKVRITHGLPITSKQQIKPTVRALGKLASLSVSSGLASDTNPRGHRRTPPPCLFMLKCHTGTESGAVSPPAVPPVRPWRREL